MNLPAKVWKMIVRLQCRFHWGGSKGSSKISMVY